MKPRLLFVIATMSLAPMGAAAAHSAGLSAAGILAAGLQAAPGQIIQVPTPPAGEQQKAEAALRKTISAFGASKPNFDDMDAPLADAVKQQSATLSTMLGAWGDLTSVEYRGWNPRNGVWAFLAGFKNGQAQCLIGFDKDGKIQTLWFKPVTV